MELVEGILNRRSIRKFTDRHITEEELHMILRAAMTGPTCANTRDWSFLVVPLWDDEKESIWMLPSYMNGIKEAGE